jgi:hypothetical protein
MLLMTGCPAASGRAVGSVNIQGAGVLAADKQHRSIRQIQHAVHKGAAAISAAATGSAHLRERVGQVIVFVKIAGAPPFAPPPFGARSRRIFPSPAPPPAIPPHELVGPRHGKVGTIHQSARAGRSGARRVEARVRRGANMKHLPVGQQIIRIVTTLKPRRGAGGIHNPFTSEETKCSAPFP